MSTELGLKETQKEWHGSLKSYIIGFILCLILTSTSFLLVTLKVLNGYTLVYTLIGLGIGQAIVQMLLFLHVGQEAKPRWETISFCFMLLCVLILVIGSLWVMHDLDKRMMPEMDHSEMNHSMKHKPELLLNNSTPPSKPS